MNTVSARLRRYFGFPATPEKVDFAITNRCDAQCYMCNNWKRELYDEMTTQQILQIFNEDELFENLNFLKITGGEPILREDLDEVMCAIKEKHTTVKIGINTNGINTKKLIRHVQSYLKRHDSLHVSVSLDGINSTHEKVRGVKGSFLYVSSTLDELRQIKEKYPDFSYKISFTITPINHWELRHIQRFANERNLRIGYRFADIAHAYNNVGSEEFIYDEDVETTLGFITLNADDYFKASLPMWFKKRKRPVSCYAFIDTCFVDANGNLYPCIYEQSVGNLLETSGKEIWTSKKSKDIRNKMKKCRHCWTECQAWEDIHKDYIKQKLWLLARSKNVDRKYSLVWEKYN